MFKAHMTLQGFPGEIASRAFPLTLKGATRIGFRSLPSRTVGSFDKMECLFMTQFMVSGKRRQPAKYLLTVKQQEGERLKLFLARFN